MSLSPARILFRVPFPLRKADYPADLTSWVSRSLPAVRSVLSAALDEMRSGINHAALLAAIGDEHALAATLDLEARAVRVAETIRTPIAHAVLDGIRMGISRLPVSLRQRIRLQKAEEPEMVFEFTAENPFVTQIAEDTAARLVQYITTAQRQTIRAILVAGSRSGTTIFDLATQIEQTVGLLPQHALAVTRLRQTALEQGLSPAKANQIAHDAATRLLRYRAMNISRTETIFSLHAGQEASWQAAAREGLFDPGTAQHRWLVSPTPCLRICAPMTNQVQPFGQSFVTGTGARVLHPGAHPSCLPGESLISITGEIQAASKRWYDGAMVTIKTAGGNELSITPNHPILTPHGWIAAGFLEKGSYVLSCSDRDGFLFEHGEDENVPTAIEHIAESFRRAHGMTARQVKIAAPHFHGDGASSEIGIVWANSFLRDAQNIEVFQQHGQRSFMTADIGIIPAESFMSHGTPTFFFERENPACYRTMSGGDLSQALCGSHMAPLEGLGFTLTAWGNTGFFQIAADNLTRDAILFAQCVLTFPPQVRRRQFFFGEKDSPRRMWHAMIPDEGNASPMQILVDCSPMDTEFLSQSLNGFSSLICVDQIMQIDVRPFHGFVYNLQTCVGWYIAQNVIVHNCRCSEELVLQEGA